MFTEKNDVQPPTSPRLKTILCQRSQEQQFIEKGSLYTSSDLISHVNKGVPKVKNSYV